MIGVEMDTTLLDNKARQKDLKKIEEAEEREREEARKNKDFTQIYPLGWKRIISLAKGNQSAFELYTFFAEHIDPTCGAVLCDQQFLADQFGVTTRTIRRWLDYLEQEKAVLRIPVAGRVCAYALDPHEVWKGYNSSKNYAAFVTKTLVNKDGEIKRKIMSMYSKKEEQDNRPDEVKNREFLEANGQTRIDEDL